MKTNPTRHAKSVYLTHKGYSRPPCKMATMAAWQSTRRGTRVEGAQPFRTLVLIAKTRGTLRTVRTAGSGSSARWRQRRQRGSPFLNNPNGASSTGASTARRRSCTRARRIQASPQSTRCVAAGHTRDKSKQGHQIWPPNATPGKGSCAY